jgi:hypothetical protein
MASKEWPLLRSVNFKIKFPENLDEGFDNFRIDDCEFKVELNN